MARSARTSGAIVPPRAPATWETERMSEVPIELVELRRLAHEARNALVPIKLCVHTLHAIDDPRAREAAELIAAGCARITEVLRELDPDDDRG
jgi:hypothetical protein